MSRRVKSLLSPDKFITLGEKRWIILDKDIANDRMLVISEDLFGSRQHQKDLHYNGWEKSLINKWLNDLSENGFVKQAGLENIDIISVPHITGYDWNGPCFSGEKIFLLSEDEFRHYFLERPEYIKNSIAYWPGTTEKYWWWLRSKGYGASYKSACVSVVITKNIVWNADPTGSYAIRPAFWMRISK